MFEMNAIQVSLLTLLTLRFFGFIIFFETGLTKKSLKNLVLSMGWLIYAAGPFVALKSYAQGGDINHPLFGFFIALGTLFLVFGLVEYYFKPEMKLLYLLLACVTLIELFLYIFLPEFTSTNSVFIQLLIILVAAFVVFAKRSWIIRNGSVHSYLWVTLFLLLSLVSIAIHLIFPEMQLSTRFFLTFLTNMTLLMAFIHFEKSQSYKIIVNKEKEIRTSLEEKEILLNEVHHRVYNNMAIMSSLLNLQTMQSQDSSVKATLKKAHSRIQAMAIVHKLLFEKNDLVRLDLRTYIERLVSSRAQISPCQLKIQQEMEEIFIPPDTLVPCGLILNELIDNTITHAYAKEESCLLYISAHIKESKYLCITVEDQGRGIPEDFCMEDSDGLGFAIIESLLTQIDATREIRRSPGFSMTFTIPLESFSEKKRSVHSNKTP